MKDNFEDKQYINRLEELIKYQYAYDILMEHFNELNHETRKTVNKQLNKLGL